MHVPFLVVQRPYSLHSSDALQSASEVATHSPSLAVLRP